MFRNSSLGRVTAALAMILGLGVASANAASISFTFTNNSQGGGSYGGGSDGNSRSFTNSGVTVVATAWSVDPSANPDIFATSRLGFYSGAGLGVCGDGEGDNCGSPSHQVDNDVRYDFVLFLFSAAVDVTSVHIKNFGCGHDCDPDTDVDYWVGNTASPLNLAGVAAYGGLAAKGFGSMLGSDVNNVAERDVLIGGAVGNALLFGARIDSDNDYFKIQSLTVNYTPEVPLTNTPVPEPGTIALFGLGLVGVATAVRRRRQAN